eukprot:GDKK01056103.1.p2 GENE.GDKK01056103.1~~GDKK01056103.1.p2  ORF type:complete len:101 (+),score=4.31 GDKK01056103.1:554-856(+)
MLLAATSRYACRNETPVKIPLDILTSFEIMRKEELAMEWFPAVVISATKTLDCWNGGTMVSLTEKKNVLLETSTSDEPDAYVLQNCTGETTVPAGAMHQL